MGANIKVLSPPLNSYPCFSSGLLVNDTIPMGLAVLFFSVVQYTPNFHIKDKLKRQVRFEGLSKEKKKKYFLLIQCLLDVLTFCTSVITI
jgi:hypothetical protein